MQIIIYGAQNCPNCEELKERVNQVVEEEGLDAEVKKINDTTKAAQKGIMSLPALTVDGEVKLRGEVASKDEIRDILNV